MSKKENPQTLSFADELKMKALLPMVKPFFGKLANMLEGALMGEIEQATLEQGEDCAVIVIDKSNDEIVISVCAVAGTTIVRPIKSYTKDTLFELLNKV